MTELYHCALVECYRYWRVLLSQINIFGTSIKQPQNEQHLYKNWMADFSNIFILGTSESSSFNLNRCQRQCTGGIFIILLTCFTLFFIIMSWLFLLHHTTWCQSSHAKQKDCQIFCLPSTLNQCFPSLYTSAQQTYMSIMGNQWRKKCIF